MVHDAFRRRPLKIAACGALALALGACAAPGGTGETGYWPAGKPLAMAIIIPRGGDPSPDARGPNGEPYCRNVGGYQAYYKRTGNPCFLGPDNYLDVGYWEKGDSLKP